MSTATSFFVDDEELAGILGISTRRIRCWRSSGKVPATAAPGRKPRWRREEILAWLEAGCPARREWERRRPAAPPAPGR